MQDKITRRALAGIATAAAAAAQTPQSPTPAATTEDLTTLARSTARTNAELIAKVKLPMSVEPAFRFKA